jgi:hypothetical protein
MNNGSETMADKETGQRSGNKRTAKVAIASSLADDVIYADGVQALAIKGGVGQIDLFQVPAATTNEVRRAVSHRVVLPLPALNELLRMPQAAAQAGTAAHGGTPGRKQ